jgi:hypothetical protein
VFREMQPFSHYICFHFIGRDDSRSDVYLSLSLLSNIFHSSLFNQDMRDVLFVVHEISNCVLYAPPVITLFPQMYIRTAIHYTWLQRRFTCRTLILKLSFALHFASNFLSVSRHKYLWRHWGDDVISARTIITIETSPQMGRHQDDSLF